ncbi:hypothetical protein HUU05_05835 [candidate division KSB1 bacterium]|nr:hypothetical protein [candidate division KSB1 bacterium]
MVGVLFFAGCKKDPVDPKPPEPTPSEFKVTDFTAPEQCASCHPNHYQEWQSSMHAYAFVDPVFFAMHDRGQQLTGGELGQFCTQCHSPIASRSGETPPFFDRNRLSPISTRGVSCDVCHSITKVNKLFNAQFAMSPGNTKFGSLDNPAPNAFHQSQFNALFDRSEICGTCHEVENTLNTRVEETYSEWVQAAVAGMSLQCQDCHMPTYAGEAAVGGPQRDKVHRHYFVGVDVPLVDFPGADLQRQMSDSLLKNAAEISVNAPASVQTGDTLRFTVKVMNTRTGHHLPSGTAAERQMWIALEARAADGSLLYQTGQLDANGDLMDGHSVLQPNADRDLVVFRQKLFDETGKEVLFFFQAKTVENNLIPLFSLKTASYKIAVPAATVGPISLDVQLRFRSLPPYFLRELNLGELVAKVPIVNMEEAKVQIGVTR